jgi:hypothetical protein
MNKTLRFIALLLIPCLLAEPLTASAAALHTAYSPIDHFQNFDEQALTLTLAGMLRPLHALSAAHHVSQPAAKLAEQLPTIAPDAGSPMSAMAIISWGSLGAMLVCAAVIWFMLRYFHQHDPGLYRVVPRADANLGGLKTVVHRAAASHSHELFSDWTYKGNVNRLSPQRHEIQEQNVSLILRAFGVSPQAVVLKHDPARFGSQRVDLAGYKVRVFNQSGLRPFMARASDNRPQAVIWYEACRLRPHLGYPTSGIEEEANVLRSIHQTLKPGGIFVAVDLSPEGKSHLQQEIIRLNIPYRELHVFEPLRGEPGAIVFVKAAPNLVFSSPGNLAVMILLGGMAGLGAAGYLPPEFQFAGLLPPGWIDKLFKWNKESSNTTPEPESQPADLPVKNPESIEPAQTSAEPELSAKDVINLFQTAEDVILNKAPKTDAETITALEQLQRAFDHQDKLPSGQKWRLVRGGFVMANGLIDLKRDEEAKQIALKSLNLVDAVDAHPVDHIAANFTLGYLYRVSDPPLAETYYRAGIQVGEEALQTLKSRKLRMQIERQINALHDKLRELNQDPGTASRKAQEAKADAERKAQKASDDAQRQELKRLNNKLKKEEKKEAKRQEAERLAQKIADKKARAAAKQKSTAEVQLDNTASPIPEADPVTQMVVDSGLELESQSLLTEAVKANPAWTVSEIETVILQIMDARATPKMIEAIARWMQHHTGALPARLLDNPLTPRAPNQLHDVPVSVSLKSHSAKLRAKIGDSLEVTVPAKLDGQVQLGEVYNAVWRTLSQQDSLRPYLFDRHDRAREHRLFIDGHDVTLNKNWQVRWVSADSAFDFGPAGTGQKMIGQPGLTKNQEDRLAEQVYKEFGRHPLKHTDRKRVSQDIQSLLVKTNPSIQILDAEAPLIREKLVAAKILLSDLLPKLRIQDEMYLFDFIAVPQEALFEIDGIKVGAFKTIEEPNTANPKYPGRITIFYRLSHLDGLLHELVEQGVLKYDNDSPKIPVQLHHLLALIGEAIFRGIICEVPQYDDDGEHSVALPVLTGNYLDGLSRAGLIALRDGFFNALMQIHDQFLTRKGVDGKLEELDPSMLQFLVYAERFALAVSDRVNKLLEKPSPALLSKFRVEAPKVDKVLSQSETQEWLENQWPAMHVDVREMQNYAIRKSLPITKAHDIVAADEAHTAIWRDGTQSLVWTGPIRRAYLSGKDGFRDLAFDFDPSESVSIKASLIHHGKYQESLYQISMGRHVGTVRQIPLKDDFFKSEFIPFVLNNQIHLEKICSMTITASHDETYQLDMHVYSEASLDVEVAYQVPDATGQGSGASANVGSPNDRHWTRGIGMAGDLHDVARAPMAGLRALQWEVTQDVLSGLHRITNMTRSKRVSVHPQLSRTLKIAA